MSEKVKITAKMPGSKGKFSFSRANRKVFSKTKTSPANQILRLQQTMGNREVQRLLKSGTLQAKLKIGKPNDKYEQEADRVADKVMSMPEPKESLVNSHSPSVQRQSTCPECPEKEGVQTKPLAEQITPLVQRQVGPEEEEEPVQTKRIQRQEAEEEEESVQTKLQRQAEDEEEEPVQTKRIQRQEAEEEEEPVHTKLVQRQGTEEEEPIQAKQAINQATKGNSNIESSVNSLKGGGQPLPDYTRSYFEPRFGMDFSQVRLHTDSKAAETAKSINAKAFTKGNDVVFGSGQYSPGTSSGKHLLAHELTHVVQQRHAPQRVHCNNKGEKKTISNIYLSRNMISGYTNRFIIQPKKIYCLDRTTLTWNDFKKRARRRASLDATIYSGITYFKQKRKVDTKDTGRICKISKRRRRRRRRKPIKQFTATVSVTFKSLPKGYMDQGKSWVKRWAKVKGRKAQCRSEILNPCNKFFKREYKKIKKVCKKLSRGCKREFSKRRGTRPRSLTYKFNKEIVIKNKKGCKKVLVSKCKEFHKKNVGDMEYKIGSKTFKAKNKEMCRDVLFEKCKEYYIEKSRKLLSHEQGHFNIACVMATKIRTALNAWAPKFTKTATKCGKKKAKYKAVKAFKRQKPSPYKTLKAVYKIGYNLYKLADNAYDLDTNHGLNEGKQKAWDKDISANLPKYKIP